MLKTYLKKAQDDIVVLLEEKRKLLDTVRNLQVSCESTQDTISSINKKKN